MDLRKEEGILAQNLMMLLKKVDKKAYKSAKKEASKLGQKREKLKWQKSYLKLGVSVDLIAESTGLPKTGIAQLKEEVTN